MRDFVTDFEENAQIFHGTREIPIGLNNIGGLMVVVVNVFIALFNAIAGRFADVVDARACFERGDASAGEFPVVGSEVEALFGGGVAGEFAALLLGDARGQIIQS